LTHIIKAWKPGNGGIYKSTNGVGLSPLVL